MNLRSGIILSGIFVFCLLTGTALSAGSQKATVYLKDSTTVTGLLLQMTPALVKIDPDGPVSLRTISADEILSVHIAGSDKTYSYPLIASEIPQELNQKTTPPKIRAQRGFRAFSLSASGGLTAPSGQYYEGISSGGGFQVGMQYRFPGGYPTEGRFFLAMSYRYSSHGATPILVGYDYAYDPVYVDFDNVHNQAIGFEFGRTTNYLGASESYFYFLMGLTLLDLGISGHLRYSDGSTEPSETSSDSKAALRMAGGSVVGLSSRVGLNFNLGVDLVIVKSNYQYYYYQNSPNIDVAGILLLFDVGLTYQL